MRAGRWKERPEFNVSLTHITKKYNFVFCDNALRKGGSNSRRSSDKADPATVSDEGKSSYPILDILIVLILKYGKHPVSSREALLWSVLNEVST